MSDANDDSFLSDVIEIIDNELNKIICPRCHRKFSTIYTLQRHQDKSHLCIPFYTMNDTNKKRKVEDILLSPHEQLGPDLKRSLTLLKECRSKGFSNQKIM